MNIFTGIQSPKVLFETDSKYNGHIKVVEFGNTLKIKVDNIDQSLNPDSPSCSRLYWGKVIDVLKENMPEMKNILILGLGGGTIPHLIQRNFPNTKMIAVEIDQVMVDIATQYFGVGQIPNLQVVVEDAMRVVVEPDKYGITEHSLDAILVDIYVGQKYPDLGKSGNFVSALKKLMNPHGLLIFNRIYVDDHQDDVNIFIDYLENQLSNVKCTVVAGYTNSDNILIYGRPL